MPDAVYTVNDSPSVVRRVEHDLGVVAETVRRSDPGLRSLVLTGGFARGEGSMLRGEPQNDYDFIAIRGLGRTRIPYAELAEILEARLGLHIDLAPISAWRLDWVSPSVFWYETALRGRVLWGENLLRRIPIQSLDQLDPHEGLRLLVNRAAGLLLVTPSSDPHAKRIQAAKGLLAAADVHMLALHDFPPSQTERWNRLQVRRGIGTAPVDLESLMPWLEWAYTFKTDPGRAQDRDAERAWQVAAVAILEAVPRALRFAGVHSLDDYARRDGLIDFLVYYHRAGKTPGLRRFLAHPTARVRVATLRLLEASLDGHVRPDAARQVLQPLVDVNLNGSALPMLETLRKATLQ